MVLDDFANGNGLTQFLDTDMAHDTLVNGVLGELELTACNFLANVINYCHGMTLYLKRISPTQYSGVSCTVRGRTLGVSCCWKWGRVGRKRGRMSPPFLPAPLRTGRDTFASSGSPVSLFPRPWAVPRSWLHGQDVLALHISRPLPSLP